MLQAYATKDGTKIRIGDDPGALAKWASDGWIPVTDLGPKARQAIAASRGVPPDPGPGFEEAIIRSFGRRIDGGHLGAGEDTIAAERLALAGDIWLLLSPKIADLVTAEVRRAIREAGWPKDAKPGKGDQP